MIVSLSISTASNVSVPENYFLELSVQVKLVAVTAKLSEIPMLLVSYLLTNVTKKTFVM